MRLGTRIILGALAAGALGCADSLAPPESTAPDLDFVMPIARTQPALTQIRGWDAPLSEQERSIVAENGEIEMTALMPSIWSAYVTAHFEADVLKFEYGMFGFGSSYSMEPTFYVHGEDGRELMRMDGAGRSETLGLYSYFRPTQEEQYQVPSQCGAKATVTVKFTARLDLSIIPVMQRQEFHQALTKQPPCTKTGYRTGGSSDGSTGGGFNICYYEVWVDLDGYIVDVFLIGCTRVGGEAAE